MNKTVVQYNLQQCAQHHKAPVVHNTLLKAFALLDWPASNINHKVSNMRPIPFHTFDMVQRDVPRQSCNTKARPGNGV
jgi:hypothetical protein